MSKASRFLAPILRRRVTCGIRWIELNGGEVDYAWDANVDGIVSVGADYTGYGDPDNRRDPTGIRWEADAAELAEAGFSAADLAWLEG